MSAPSSRLTAALSDRYSLERELGQGGMATVYLAEDLKHKRKVAIKVLKPELAAVLERFVQEITTTAALQHPHILPLFDSGTAEGFLFYVMPFIDGETLRAKLDRETQLGVEEAVKITVDVADALDYAHSQGVVHRDIKPENILLHNGRPMVADFGIALALSAAAGGRMTETGLSLGTPHYMSPEQATAEKEITSRSDIYSLGSVLYEMLTGNPPHTGASAQQIIMKIVTEDAQSVARLRKSVPPHVAAAVATALEKLPADRFESAKAFAEALNNPSYGALAGQGYTAYHTAAGTSTGRRLLPWGLALAGFATAAALALLQPAPRPTPPVRFAIPLEGGGLSMDVPGHGLALSADGQVLVYASEARGVPILFRRRLGDLESRAITGTEGGFQPVLSPDGRWVGFATREGLLKRVELDGGAPVTLATTTTPIGMSWSDRAGLVLGMPLYSDSILGLTAVPVEGANHLARITDPTGGDSTLFGMHHDPIALADGVTALYVDIRRGPGTGPSLGVVNLPTGTTTRLDLPLKDIVGLAEGVLVYRRRDNSLMAVRFDPAGPAILGVPVRVQVPHDQVRDAVMSPDGTLAMLMAPAAFEVVLLDQEGRATAILPDTVNGVIPRFSPSGGQAILSTTLRGARVPWVYDFATGSLTRLTGRSSVLEWSLAGKALLTVPFGNRAVSQMSLDPDDSTSRLVQVEEGQLSSASLSPDLQTVALGVGVGAGEFDIVLKRIGEGTSTVPFAATPANEIAPRFSPDGRWLTYASDESGRFEVYVRPASGPGARLQVSDQGGGQPVWSRDGRTLYYRVGRAMMAAQLRIGTVGQLEVSQRRTLFEGEFADPAVSALWAAYDVAPDGRFLMARALGGSRSEIVLWLNWLGEIREQLDAR